MPIDMGDRRKHLEFLRKTAKEAIWSGDYERALTLYEDGLALSRSWKDRELEDLFTCNRATTLLDVGQDVDRCGDSSRGRHGESPTEMRQARIPPRVARRTTPTGKTWKRRITTLLMVWIATCMRVDAPWTKTGARTLPAPIMISKAESRPRLDSSRLRTSWDSSGSHA